MTQHYSTRHPVRQLPRLTQEQIIAQARQQAMQEADEDEILDEAWPTRLPTSTRRYQDYTISPERIMQKGNKRYHLIEIEADIPKRKSRQQLPPARERYTEEIEALPQAKRKKHPIFIFGVGMIAMLALWVLLSSAANWIQTTKDDLSYGRPRTFNIDAVVGHADSAANPSHFQAINLNRHIEVIEWPGLDSSKMKVYQITTLFGDNEDLTPVTLTFADLLGNGKLDMLIHIHNNEIAFINDNGTFRPAKPGEVKGLVS